LRRSSALLVWSAALNHSVLRSSAVGFRLHLQTCNLGTRARTVRNPFTGATLAVPGDLALTAEDRQAVRALLQEVGAGEPDPDTYRRIELPGGSIVDIAVGTLDDDAPCIGFAVECSDLTAEGASFLYALASRGNLSVGSSIDPQVVALTRPEQRERVARWYPKVSMVGSPSRLRVWLERQLRAGKIV
jgi:hypothetical protein